MKITLNYFQQRFHFMLAPSSKIDPFSDAFFSDPFPHHAALRAQGAVVFLEKYNIYAFARYKNVKESLTDWETFCSSRGVGMSDFAKETPWRPPSLVLEKDPPEHDRARNVLNKVLSPQVMKGLRETMHQKAQNLISALKGKEVEVISEIAERFPFAVFPDAIGLKNEGREHLLPYASAVFNVFGPDNALRRDAIAQSAPHTAWVLEQCQRENLSLNGIGAMIHAQADEGVITKEEAPLLVRSLLSAGLDTTVNGIGAALYCLARFPQEFAKLKADSSLARSAFEEAIRYESPVQTFFRTTTREVDIEGVTLPEGAKVLLLLGSANRDPQKWENADDYDIARVAAGHVGYGAGVHVCAGQLLARLEGEAILTALAKYIETMEIIAEPERAFNNTLRGLKTLQVRLT